jgi:conjugal transfer ATP-binding protein TraC
MNNQPLNKKIELSGHEQRMPGIPLVGRQGIPFLWNPFSSMLLPGSIRKNDDETISFNVCIAGCPESGKTTFIEQMIDTVVGVGGRVFVFDKGKSFKSICERLKGQHIELDACLPISLNPFSNVSIDDECLHNDMMETIFAFFQVMVASKQGTSDLQNSYIYLQEAINYSWEKYKNKSSVDTVKEFLDQHEELAAKNIGQALYPFSGKGTYGQFFNKQANAGFKEKLTVIEMERLQDNQPLMTLIIYTFLIQIFQEMAKGDRLTPFLIIIEEPGQILDQKLSENLSGFQRGLRMKKGGIVWSTTDLNDFFNPDFPLACDVFNGTAWKCIFEQQADVIDSLKRYPRLPSLIDNERKEALLYSLHSQLPEYSEVAIYDWNDNAVVGRLHLDSQGNPLYFSEPKDYWQMEKDTHIEDICEESSFQELKYSTNAPAYRLIEGKESEKEKQSPVNSHLPLPKKELSALGWGIIIGIMSLLFLPVILEKFSINLPVASSLPPVWKLLFQRGSSGCGCSLWDSVREPFSRGSSPLFSSKKAKTIR